MSESNTPYGPPLFGNVQTLNPHQQKQQDALAGTFMFIPGDHAKIKRCSERFWVKVEEMTLDGNYTGTVDNDMLCTDEHGLSYGDTVNFKASEVLGVLQA